MRAPGGLRTLDPQQPLQDGTPFGPTGLQGPGGPHRLPGMPCLDLPLDQLRSYAGRSPRPADHDAYWAAALADLDRLGLEWRLERAAFQAPGVECHDLYAAGTRGAVVHAKYLKPTGAARAPVCLLFHGYSNSSGGWFDKLGWVQHGFAVLAMDCRGQGGLSTDPGGVAGTTLKGHIVRGLSDPDAQRLYYRDVFLDTALMARIAAAMPGHDPQRMVASGWSQGGALTLVCAALHPAIRRIAPVYPFLCDYRRVWEMDLAKDAYADIREWLRSFDPTHERIDATFGRLGYIDVQFLAPRIRAQTLMVTGLADAICPPSTQFAAYNRITAPKETLIYPDFGHEQLPGAHERIAEFLRQA